MQSCNYNRQLIPQFSTIDISLSSALTYDYIRTEHAAVFGCFIHAPLSHVHYNFFAIHYGANEVHGLLDTNFESVYGTIRLLVVDWGISIYFTAMGAMQGLNLSQIYQRICDVLWETQGRTMEVLDTHPKFPVHPRTTSIECGWC